MRIRKQNKLWIYYGMLDFWMLQWWACMTSPLKWYKSVILCPARGISDNGKISCAKLNLKTRKKFFCMRDLWSTPHAVTSTAAGANDVSVSLLCQGFKLVANGSSHIDTVAPHNQFNRKGVIFLLAHGRQLGGIASVASALSCACVQSPAASIRN
jgi:hypothetical protein